MTHDTSGVRSRKTVWKRLLPGAVVAVLLVAFGLYWFQPWKLFTTKTISDTPATGAVVLARGDLVSHEHETSGTAVIVRLPSGGHQLELRDLATSDGPDVRVWLSGQPVLAGRDGWHVFDDGDRLELGRLKGTHGTQVYDVPEGTDLSRYTSVTIWCARFSVSFGAAALARA